MKQMYLLRHFEAQKHPLFGYTLDILTERGEEQAKIFSDTFTEQVTHLVSSSNNRALLSATAIATKIGIHVKKSDKWKEISRGVYTERPYSEFLDEWSKNRNSYDYVPPGGESVNQGRLRIANGIDEITSLDGNVLCVTHMGVISNILGMLYGFDFERATPGVGELCELSFDGTDITLHPNKHNSFLGINSSLSAPYEKLKTYK